MPIQRIRSAGATMLFLCAAVLVFARPGAAMAGVQRGLQLCAATVIPTMFPFLVLSNLLLDGPAARWLGVLFLPYTRLLHIQSRRAPAAMLCGILGGFAAGSHAIGQLYEDGEISAGEAQRLLVCTIGSSPAFLAGSVGTAMLGSAAAGWLLFGAQFFAGLVCGLLVRPKSQRAGGGRRAPAPAPRGFAQALSDSVWAMALLCGYITLFSFFAAVAVPAGAGPLARYWITLPLEVTGACDAAAQSADGARLLLCGAACSLMGASVFVQVRAFTGPDIGLAPLLWSRILHLPLMLGALWGLARLFPHALAASVPDGGWVTALRMPADLLCLLFVFFAILSGAGLPARWQRGKKGV